MDGKMIVAAEIPGVEVSERPVFYSGVGRIKGSYVRVGDGDELMNEYEIYSYEAFRKRIRDDQRVLEYAKLSMFDKELLDKYLRMVKQERSNLSQNVSDQEILELMAVTDNGVPTVAGTMVFSRYPQTYLPGHCITAVVVPGTEIGDIGDDGERFMDNKKITGPIPLMLEDAVEFVRRNSRTKTIVGEDGNRHDKTEYPMKAVREVILNALVHRDYSIHTENTPVSVEMYRDRLVVRSSGGLYGNVDIELLGKSRPDTRNAALANILEILQVTENRYSGIPTIYKECKNALLPPPGFEVKRGEFVVTIWNEYNRGTEFFSIENIDKSDMKAALLQFCTTPRTREEITGFTGMSRYYTMSNIVKPLLNAGKLQMTVPEKPRSHNQRYFTAN